MNHIIRIGRILAWLAVFMAALLPTVLMLIIVWPYLMLHQTQLIETALVWLNMHLIYAVFITLTLLPWPILPIISIQRDHGRLIHGPEHPTDLAASAK